MTVPQTDPLGLRNGGDSDGSPEPLGYAGYPAPTLHIGDLDGERQTVTSSTWQAKVTITVHNGQHGPVPGATVTGKWSNRVNVTAVTGTDGTCLVSADFSTKTRTVTFTVTNVSANGYGYVSSANHDGDGDSNGTAITVSKP